MFSVLFMLVVSATSLDLPIVLNAVGPSPEIDAEIAKVRAARDAAVGAEKPIYERLLAALEKARKGPFDAPNVISNMATVCREALELYRNDAAMRVQIVASCIMLPETAQSVGVDPTELRSEALARAKALVADFPKESRAWEIYAFAIADEREIILALKKCHALSPSETRCRERHVVMVRGLVRPQCLTKDVAPTLAAFGASDAIPGITISTPSIKWQGSLFALEPTPVFGAADIAVVSRDPNEERVIDMVLTPAGATKLATASARLADSHGRMALMLGEQPLTVAHVVEPLTNGRLRLSTGTEPSEAMHYRLCTKVHTPKVPDELRLN